MKLSVGFNWDPKLLEQLSEFPVHDVFCALPNTPMGGGRPGFMLPEASEGMSLKDYVEMAHSSGIKFTYLLNAPCLNNLEFDERIHNEFLAFLEDLNKANVDFLTISIPYFIELVREQFPAFKIKSSVIQQINSIRRAQLFEELGTSVMNPDYMINRDFKLLKQMKSALKGELMLLVNDLCMYQCPFRYYHYNMIGHASQNTNPLGNFYIDYCATRCTLLKFGNPSELLRARWIRPEDIKEYQALGIEYFKISGRNLSTSWLLRAVKAYTEQKYDGNLLDILMRASVGLNMDYHSPHFEKLLTDEVLADERLKSFVRMADVPFITANIDNTKLDGFLEPFKTIDCLSTNCRECRHCDDWAKKVVTRDPELTKQYMTALNQVYKDLTTSKYFRALDG
ncbi:MAG: U32 family peptidase, partial [Promethearchaeota archaeon]